MRSFEQLGSWLHAVVASAAIISADYFQVLFAKLGLQAYYLVGPILLAVIGIRISDLGASFLVENIRIFRRVLSGKDDIEGDWVNIVVDVDDPMTLKYVEFCRIQFVSGQYQISGDSWTPEGRWVQDFASGGSTYLGREFEYYYKTGLGRVGGYGVIRFTPHDALPSDFICRYFDESAKVPHITRGRRLSMYGRRLALDARRDAALQFAKDYEEKGLLDIRAALG